MTITLSGISKVFPNGTVALDDFTLRFEQGEFIVLLGPSGSGKSTACRILAGLETPSAGSVAIAGRDVTDLAPRERGMSMVFQNYALYPHKSVYENIAYPLRIRKRDKQAVDGAVREIATMLDIAGLLDRRPGQLSGGEAQRVAVARALVWQPEICLMDEPLSNLDALLRLQTRAELKRIHRDLKKTFVFVTHDQEEAMSLGTRIAVLDNGRLIQFDTPKAIYHRPATRFVAEFIGRPAMNTIEGEIATTDAGRVFRHDDLTLSLGHDTGPKSGPVVMGVRPEEIQVCDQPGDGSIAMNLDVADVIEPDTLLSLQRGPVHLVVRAMRTGLALQPGDEVHITVPGEALHFFSTEDGRRL